MTQTVPLEMLQAGEEGRILDIDGERAMVTRLAEMGLREGVSVRMVKAGVPCIVAIGNHRISFRGEESTVVLVEITSTR